MHLSCCPDEPSLASSPSVFFSRTTDDESREERSPRAPPRTRRPTSHRLASSVRNHRREPSRPPLRLQSDLTEATALQLDRAGSGCGSLFAARLISSGGLIRRDRCRSWAVSAEEQRASRGAAKLSFRTTMHIDFIIFVLLL